MVEPSFEEILVPTDGSAAAKRAGEHAIDLAKRYDGTVHTLYVMDMGDAGFVATPSDIGETRNRLEEKGQEYTDEIKLLAVDEDVDVVTEIRTGIPEDEVIEYIDEEDIDLLVMGKRGRSDPDKPLFGTLTGRLIGHLDIPVHTV
ncbi:universal stress protein [Halanaeroarchaeum sulfurireducens]|uniref:UspA domain-containing protein n=1 Tax=Halanaeroarchaeum sulfurireducens TaxID=1604004 RepID=A0A0F7PD33_9EURY|nr:universal stress protein [Halanaeroarchaeum sulfurireducens]AKH97233.1 UspA domain-containing protein [Halanaeroarchaeum sulfurireducens]ALG81635.1 UspA domain-containing protein [Halanaeroarchaeum sulfurireducens]